MFGLRWFHFVIDIYIAKLFSEGLIIFYKLFICQEIKGHIIIRNVSVNILTNNLLTQISNKDLFTRIVKVFQNLVKHLR